MTLNDRRFRSPMVCRTHRTYSYQVDHGHHMWAVEEGATEIMALLSLDAAQLQQLNLLV